MKMNRYNEKYAKNFLRDIKKIKNSNLKERLKKKKKEIISNPHQYKPLRNILKGNHRIHIGSYVLIYEIKEAEKIVIFHRFQPHDKVYKKTV